MISKSKIVDQLIKQVEVEITSLSASCKQAHDDVCGGQMKSDGKYDTRAIESSYLVGAQKKRIEELKLELKLLEGIEVRPFEANEEVSIGALVEIELNGAIKNYFISSTAGGTLLNVDGSPVLVISVFSPIGSEIMGLKVNDRFELDTVRGERIYTITSIS